MVDAVVRDFMGVMREMLQRIAAEEACLQTGDIAALRPIVADKQCLGFRYQQHYDAIIADRAALARIAPDLRAELCALCRQYARAIARNEQILGRTLAVSSAMMQNIVDRLRDDDARAQQYTRHGTPQRSSDGQHRAVFVHESL